MGHRGGGVGTGEALCQHLVINETVSTSREMTEKEKMRGRRKKKKKRS